jgi:hypothetical protein
MDIIQFDNNAELDADVRALVNEPVESVEIALVGNDYADIPDEDKMKFQYYIFLVRDEIRMHEKRVLELMVLAIDENLLRDNNVPTDKESFNNRMKQMKHGKYIHMLLMAMLRASRFEMFYKFISEYYQNFDINLHGYRAISPIEYFMLHNYQEHVFFLVSDIQYKLDMSYCWDAYMQYRQRVGEEIIDEDTHDEAFMLQKTIAKHNISDRVKNLVFILSIYMHGVSHEIFYTTRNIIYDITIKSIAYKDIEKIIEQVDIPNTQVTFDPIDTEIHFLNTADYHDDLTFDNLVYMNYIFDKIENYIVSINQENEKLKGRLRTVSEDILKSFKENYPNDIEIHNKIQLVLQHDQMDRYLECYRHLLMCYNKYELEELKIDLQILLKDLIIAKKKR